MDRFSSRHCLERTLAAVNDAGISIEPRLEPHLRPELVSEARARITAGAPGADRLVLLNPGGAFPTRRWPTVRWVELARRFPHRTAFVITGLERVADVARMLRAADDVAVVDLVGRSSLAEGLAAVAACDLAITEDGAFMHAAWTGGVPTVALLGGMRSDWVRPLGPRARYRGSDDLPCGNCMLAVCARGDVHCLDRVGVDEVIAMAISVMDGAT
jgi:ADP-heptose:LPS heptosyltransferase